MVNTLSHLGIGLLVASLRGLEGRQRKLVVFLSALPDLDFIANAVFFTINGTLDHQLRNQLFLLLGHREFMHSFLFMLIIISIVWVHKHNMKLTIAGYASILSHFYLDYITSWKMRPLYPFSTESSILGSVDFFDPVITIISFIPIYFLFVRLAGNNGKTRKYFRRSQFFLESKEVALNRMLILILVMWFALTPVSKALLVDHISVNEGYDISYGDSYPKSFARFISAY